MKTMSTAPACRRVAPTRPPMRVACALFALLVLLSGCASQRAFDEANALLAEGKIEAGLARLEEAVRLEPGKSEYRIALAGRRTSLVNQWVTAGETARRDGRLTDAEKAYMQALAYDPNQVMARQGLEALTQERRHRQLVKDGEGLLQRGGPDDLTEAMARLRTVLTENPNHREALNLKARINDQLAKQVKPEARLAAAYRKPITLEFRDAALRSVFDVIAKASGLNFFFDKDIRPDLRATILARNTSIEESLRLLLTTNQLEQKVLNENSVLIYPSTPQKLKDYQSLSVRSFFLANADVKAVSNSIKTIVKTKDLVIDERLGLIIMRDTPEAIRVAERIVALQDISDPEVMLDVEILEVKRSKLLELGVRWPGSLTLSPLPSSGTTLTLDALRSLSGSGIQATVGGVQINANQQNQAATTLANPRIRVRNKEKAKILIGDRVPIISTTSGATGFVTENVTYVEVGLKLDVEPAVYLDDEVAIKIALEVSSLGAQTASKAGTITYQIGTRGASTVLRLRDGETQILAGLISDDERASANKLPGLGDLPIAGRLFGSQNDEKQRSEILLSITPRVLRSIRRPDLVAAEFESGTESTVGADSLRLSRPEPATGGATAAATTGAELPRQSSGPATPPFTPAMATAGSAPAQPVAPSAPQALRAVVAPPAPVALAGTPMSPVVQASPPPALSWMAPAQVKAGEQFSAVLRMSSQTSLRGMPLLLAYDPQVLQVVSVTEGDFFSQGNAKSTFSHRIDPTQGRIFMAVVRQAASGVDAGINGSGSLATVTFKAAKASTGTRLQVLSATPEPAGATLPQLPVESLLRIVP